MTTLATPVKAAGGTQSVRPRVADRPWYAYAARLLPARAETGRWVDLGCGQGEFLELAQGVGQKGFGLDFSPDNALAVRRDGRSAVVADLNRPLPFRDLSLDGASLVEVIEHIVRAEDLLLELSRVIRPGGWLVLTTPNVAHLTYRWRALTGHPPKQEGYHYRFFTKKTLHQSLERAGFRWSGAPPSANSHWRPNSAGWPAAAGATSSATKSLRQWKASWHSISYGDSNERKLRNARPRRGGAGETGIEVRVPDDLPKSVSIFR